MMQFFYFPWSTCMTTLLVAVGLFLPHVYTEIFDFAKCDINDNFQSAYVASSFRSLKAGHTCENNATSASGQEVHVIMVDAPPDRSGWLTVRLSIHSRRESNLRVTEGVDYQEQHRPLLMVLHANAHVKWKVDIDGVSSQDKHVFTIAKGSSIKFYRKRTRLTAKSRKRDFREKMSKSELYHWAKSRLGGVTSFNVISNVSLQFYVGRDVNANSVCNVNSLNESLRIFSFNDVTQPIRGCVSKRRNHVIANPVFIVEMLEPPPYSPGVTGVSLELLLHKGDGEEENPNARNCDLVIKSPKNITWNVQSKSINGQIQIVYDADVKTAGVRYSSVGSRPEVISSSGRALVEWTQEHVAPVLLYAGIQGANSIKLWIPLLENALASPRDKTTDPNRRTQSPPVNTKADLQDARSKLINTTCVGGEMRVAIPRKFMQVTGLESSKISLKDPTCTPEAETEDYIILRTSLDGCGTQSINIDDMTSYTNVVLIQTPPGLVSSLLEAELGSGFFDREAGSGSNDMAGGTDDEDFGVDPVNITVECKLPSIVISEVKPQTPSGKCHMTLYRDQLFLRARIDNPTLVAKDTTVYIKAATDKDTMIQVDSCWFSTSKHPYQPAAQTVFIIRNGCEQSANIVFLDPTGAISIPEETRFKVIVRENFQDQATVYLHCQFYTCQKQLPNCPVNRHQRCQHNSLDSSFLRPNCGPVTLGPIEITGRKINIRPPQVHGREEESNLNQQQRVIIEGLDSATVVGIAFAAFAIGILLTGALWFIHSHTGPVKRGVTDHREPDASGDLTPNSSSPMTA